MNEEGKWDTKTRWYHSINDTFYYFVLLSLFQLHCTLSVVELVLFVPCRWIWIFCFMNSFHHCLKSNQRSSKCMFYLTQSQHIHRLSELSFCICVREFKQEFEQRPLEVPSDAEDCNYRWPCGRPSGPDLEDLSRPAAQVPLLLSVLLHTKSLVIMAGQHELHWEGIVRPISGRCISKRSRLCSRDPLQETLIL